LLHICMSLSFLSGLIFLFLYSIINKKDAVSFTVTDIKEKHNIVI
jgi:hypothetical protein